MPVRALGHKLLLNASIIIITDAAALYAPTICASENAVEAQTVAQVNQGAAQSSAGDSEQAILTEIIVSAQKRGDENLLRVPVPVAVVNTQQLAESNLVSLVQYYGQVPGLTVAPNSATQVNLSIRGITTGGNPTVGVLIDDVPFGSATQQYIPDLDPGDLARVEVLRGPQGTLFGSDSMGGLIRFVTIAPSTDAFSGQVSAGTDSIHSGDGYGFNIRGSVNLPISDTIAIRASAFRRDEPGYIYDALTNNSDSHRVSAAGERISALWRPSELFSVTLSAISQTVHDLGGPESVLGGDNLSTYAVAGLNNEVMVQNFSAVIKAGAGPVQITSITGFNTINQRTNSDASDFLGPLAPVFGFPPYVIATNPLSNNKFSQELRASASVGATLDVLAGLFYTHEKTLPSASIYGVNPYTAAPTTPVNGFSLNDPSTLDEYAAFTDLTYHFTSQLDVQLGVRADHIDQVFPAFFTYSPVPPSPSVTPRTWAHATPVTYLLTPQYFITPDLMLYARAASGYRPGGSNTTPGVPPQFDPDKTYTYEAGTKDSFLGSRLTADLSVYYVAWKDIQTQTQANGNGFPFTGNGGGAKSQGVELTVTAKPFRATTVSGWVDYDDAVLTKALPSAAGYGLAGDRLPLSTKYSGNISIRQDLPAFSGVAPFASIDASYTGNRVGIFQPTALRQEYGGYTQTNIVAGINYQAWLVNGYVNNVTDSRGELNGGLGYGFNKPLLFLFIQPRTVGLSFTRKF